MRSSCTWQCLLSGYRSPVSLTDHHRPHGTHEEVVALLPLHAGHEGPRLGAATLALAHGESGLTAREGSGPLALGRVVPGPVLRVDRPRRAEQDVRRVLHPDTDGVPRLTTVRPVVPCPDRSGHPPRTHPARLVRGEPDGLSLRGLREASHRPVYVTATLGELLDLRLVDDDPLRHGRHVSPPARSTPATTRRPGRPQARWACTRQAGAGSRPCSR